MNPEQLIEYYPRLYHLAWEGSWKNINQYGLLPTQELLNLYHIDERKTKKLVSEHRPDPVTIEREGLYRAVLRDQKPMSDAGLRAAGILEPKKWYSVLNSMVFFWATKERLESMMNAYQGMKQDLIIVNTRRLVEDTSDAIRLSHMNSGSTRRGHPRNVEIFKTISDYPFDKRRKKNGWKKALAEVCVIGGVKAIKEYIVDVRTISSDDLTNIE